MKMRFIVFSLIFFVFWSCSTEKPNFVVTGTITESSDNYVVLSEMKRQGFITVDSTKMDELGAFVLRGKTDSAKMYALSMKGMNDYITLVVNPEDEITVEIEQFSFPVNYKIAGSKDSKLILTTHESLFVLLNQKVMLNKYYKDNINNRELGALRAEVKYKIDSLDYVYKKQMIAFVTENATSLGCLPALFQQIGMGQYLFDSEYDLEIYQYVDSVLMGLYPNAEPVLSLHEQVESIKAKSIRMGKQVPDISLLDPEGKIRSLSSLRGKVVLLDFWASWCPPCRKESPALVAAYKKYHQQGFEIFQVSLDKSKPAWTTAIAADNLDWIHVSDLGYWNSSVVAQFGIEEIPTNYLLDEKGRMIAKNLFGQALDNALTDLYK